MGEGDLNLTSEQVNAFFRLMDQRYGRVSTILLQPLDVATAYSIKTVQLLFDALRDGFVKPPQFVQLSSIAAPA